MKTPENLLYTESHEWVRKLGDGTFEIGITDFAQHAMGDIVYADLPEAGEDVTAGEEFATVESVKAVSSVYAPCSGKVARVNDALADAPEALNADPYGAWLIAVEGVSDEAALLDADAYARLCEKEK